LLEGTEVLKEQSDNRIKLTMFLDLGKVPLNVETDTTADGKD